MIHEDNRFDESQSSERQSLEFCVHRKCTTNNARAGNFMLNFIPFYGHNCNKRIYFMDQLVLRVGGYRGGAHHKPFPPPTSPPKFSKSEINGVNANFQSLSSRHESRTQDDEENNNNINNNNDYVRER